MKKLLFAVAFALTCLASSAQTLTVEQATPYVEVRGTAKTTIMPNKIEVSIQLSELPSKGKVTLADQQKQLATALTQAGIDIQKQLVITSQSTAGDKRKIAYEFKNYLLTVSTAEELGAVFTAFDQNGIQNAQVTRVYNDAQAETRLAIRAQAIKNAKQIAKTLVQAIDQEIGAAIQITDYTSGSDGYNNSFLMRASKAAVSDETSMPLDLQMRPIEIEQTVLVRFKLIPLFQLRN